MPDTATTTYRDDQVQQSLYDIDVLLEQFNNNQGLFLQTLAQFDVQTQKEILVEIKTDLLLRLYSNFQNVLPALKTKGNSRLFDIGHYVFNEANNIPAEYEESFLETCKKLMFIEKTAIEINLPKQIDKINQIISSRYTPSDPYIKIIQDGELAKVFIQYIRQQPTPDQKFTDDIAAAFNIKYFDFDDIESYYFYLIHYLYRLVILEKLAIIASGGNYDNPVDLKIVQDLLPIVIRKILENNDRLYLVAANPQIAFSTNDTPEIQNNPVGDNYSDIQLDIG